MSNLEIGLLSFPALLGLIFIRLPIGLAMFIVGLVGLYPGDRQPQPAAGPAKSETYTTFSSYSLSIVPMFLLMGHFATLGGMSNALFRAAEGWLGHRKGGVAMAAVGACAGFGAICGSSLATAATMGRVALPELRQYGYAGGFSTATLAAGGTLGILIPPSVVLVIYAILTEQNIAKLFLAAFIPGIMAALGYVLAISLYVRLHPGSAGTRAAVPMGERFRALLDVWPVLLVFSLVVGGIYLGWFTPTEGAAVGAAGTGLIAFLNRGLTRKTLVESFTVTAKSTAMIFFIILWGRVLQRVSCADTGAAGDIQFRGQSGVFAMAGAVDYSGVLSGVRMPDGFAVDDPSDHSDILSGGLGAGFRHDRRAGGDLVRNSGADRGGSGFDHAAGGHEPVCDQRDGP